MRRLAAAAVPDLRQSAIRPTADVMTRACRRETGSLPRWMFIPWQSTISPARTSTVGSPSKADREFSLDHEV